jgi:hypothetical protein
MLFLATRALGAATAQGAIAAATMVRAFGMTTWLSKLKV